MALMPKRVKHRKSQRGRIRGNATRGNRVVFGEFGLQSEEGGWLSAQTIEAGRIAAQQYIRGEGKLYIRVFPHKSITSIPLETRMGKGKGEPEFWAAVHPPGHGAVRAGGRDRGAGEDVLRAAGSQDAGPRADGEENVREAVSDRLSAVGQRGRRLALADSRKPIAESQP